MFTPYVVRLLPLGIHLRTALTLPLQNRFILDVVSQLDNGTPTVLATVRGLLTEGNRLPRKTSSTKCSRWVFRLAWIVSTPWHGFPPILDKSGLLVYFRILSGHSKVFRSCFRAPPAPSCPQNRHPSRTWPTRLQDGEPSPTLPLRWYGRSERAVLRSVIILESPYLSKIYSLRD